MLPELDPTPAVADRPHQGIAVIGGGTMGTGIAYVFAMAGRWTTVVEPSDARAAAMLGELASAAANAVRRGKLDDAGATALCGRIRRTRTIAELDAGLALIVESVPEKAALKQGVLAAAEDKRPTVLASNTSSISINLLGGSLRQPETFLGMHFFNPVWSLPLVEVVRGQATSAATVAHARALVSAIGKQSIVVADVPGFATSRLDLIASLEAMRMLEDGVASAEDIDRASELAYRHPVGPLRLSDIVGLDVRLDIARQLEGVFGERYRPPRILIDMVAAGHLGRKSGRGFYDWVTQ
ncbi:MAG: 3-hydroxyacyl-CoA dehydrogenase family protein [Burkholderiales bacterium]